MTTQRKQAADVPESTQQTMTEAEVLASEEFTETVRALQEQSIKPGDGILVTFPYKTWSPESIRTYFRLLLPRIPDGLGYFTEARADDENEYFIVANKPIMAEIATA